MLGSRDFAAHFDATTEIPLVNTIFLAAIRGGSSTVDDVYTAVEISVREQLREAAQHRNKERHAKLDNMIYYFEHYPEEACQYAEYYLWWETLSKEEKDKEREPTRIGAIADHQRQQPASEKQITYLRSLGYSGAVSSKKHASDIIEAITKQGAA